MDVFWIFLFLVYLLFGMMVFASCPQLNGNKIGPLFIVTASAFVTFAWVTPELPDCLSHRNLFFGIYGLFLVIFILYLFLSWKEGRKYPNFFLSSSER